MFTQWCLQIVTWAQGHWLLWLPLLLGVIGHWLLTMGKRPALGAVFAAFGLTLLWLAWLEPGAPRVEAVLFTAFGVIAVAAGFRMLVEQNPVYAALWFALVILATCGLFLLNSAAFLSAATIIVYAGAIVVTFLFVIMLAQQRGTSASDRRFNAPLGAGILGGALLAVLLTSIESTGPTPAGMGFAPVQPEQMSLRSLGKTLFADYLWPVEIAGALLFAATIGTIIIAMQAREGRS